MYYFILNPVSGGGRVATIQNKLKKRLSSLGLVGDFMKTSGEGDAWNLARIAVKKGYSTVVCVGGDSTIHEVLNGVQGTDVALGIIPIGYRNILASRLGIPTNIDKAIDIIRSRYVEMVDIGRANELKENFVLSCGFGAEIDFLTEVGKNRTFFERLIGDEKIFSSLLMNQTPKEVTFTIDKSYKITTQILSASIINAGFLSNDVLRKYEFSYKDRLLDLVIISSDGKPFTKTNVFSGSKIGQSRYTSIIQASHIEIECLHEQLKMHIDGRILAKTPVTIQILPTKQRFIIKKPF